MLRRRMSLEMANQPPPPALLPRGTTTSHPHPEPLQGPPFCLEGRDREPGAFTQGDRILQ